MREAGSGSAGETGRGMHRIREGGVLGWGTYLERGEYGWREREAGLAQLAAQLPDLLLLAGLEGFKGRVDGEQRRVCDFEVCNLRGRINTRARTMGCCGASGGNTVRGLKACVRVNGAQGSRREDGDGRGRTGQGARGGRPSKDGADRKAA